MQWFKRSSALVVLGLSSPLWLSGSVAADEGMWLLNQPPRQLLQQRHQFKVEQPWLDHLMHSSVRFNVGGSGSFVSPDGLVMTNHHVAADAIQKLSGPGRDLIKLGFKANKRQQELPCQDLELDVLQSIEDVSNSIRASIQPTMDEAAAEKARRAAINTLEQTESKKSGLHCQVVTLYKGGAYHLYRYQRYTDVRLVFAPELGSAFFGGDSDNFEYPRQCLDCTFLRVYHQGRPLASPDYLRWAPQGVQSGDLVFVSGHPGRTNRLNTVNHLKYFRDQQYPQTLDYLRRLEVLFDSYGERSAENHRQCQDDRFGVQNSRKARLGGLGGLQDPSLMQQKLSREQQLRQRIQSDPQLQAAFGSAWQEVDRALERLQALQLRYSLLEQGRAFNSSLFQYARTLVRRSQEMSKPNAERLREYAEANRESLEQSLFAEIPHYPSYEETKLADSLAFLMERLGADDPSVVKILQGKSPRSRAQELVNGSGLLQAKVRRQMAGLSSSELKASGDPMLALAWEVEEESRRLRGEYDRSVALALEKAYAQVAQAVLASAGPEEVYPDATFSLRLAFGKVQGYQGLSHTTDLASLYRKSQQQQQRPPFSVPVSWLKAKKNLKLSTPFNFVCTADIIGGNSGSPVVNRLGQVVGLIFDGNLDSLVWDFHYDDQRGRALAVDSRAIVEALRQVYGLPQLADELEGRRP